MEWAILVLQFVERITEILIWPALIVFIIYKFRMQLNALVENLERFRFILVHIHRQRSSFGILGY